MQLKAPSTARHAVPLPANAGEDKAAVEATEEAVVNALFAAETMEGHRGRIEALPVDEVVRFYRRGTP